MLEMWAIPLVLVSSFLSAFGTFQLKLVSHKADLKMSRLVFDPRFLVGMMTLVASAVLFIMALRGGPLTILFPMTSLTYVWASMMAIKFLKESMNLKKWGGVLAIVFGIALIAFM